MASLVRRGENYYVQWRIGKKRKRRSLRTDSVQTAKEKLRQFESAQVRGDDLPLPTRTKVTDIITRCVEHIRTVKTAKSAQTDIYFLRQVICPALQINSRKASIRAMKKPPKSGQDRRFKMSTLDVSYLEEITTADTANFISAHVRSRGLAPKTANRYREVLHTFFSWAISEQGVKMPFNQNPVSKVSRYKEHAPKIRFLTLTQVEEQLRILEKNHLLPGKFQQADFVFDDLLFCSHLTLLSLDRVDWHNSTSATPSFRCANRFT